MAKTNKKSRNTQKSPAKSNKDLNRHPKNWDQEKSADTPYDESIESPRSGQKPTMF